LYHLGQYPEAISNAQKALDIFPDFGKAYINMARAYAESEIKDKAREACTKALQVDPEQKVFSEQVRQQIERLP
jgi:tetratricopeptide (TPR) repeat protein